MITSSNNDKIYLGKNAGEKIFYAIKNAEHFVKIVSPYLSSSYVKELVKLSEKGIKITLITSDGINEDDFSDFKLSDIIKKKEIYDEALKHKKKLISNISLIMFFVSLISFIPFFTSPYLIIIPIIIITISITGMVISYFIKPLNYQYYSIFRLKVFLSNPIDKPRSKELIHSKIYVIDDKIAFLGSANFTYSGFKKHYESVILVEDTNAVKNISNEVENLFNSEYLGSKSIDELGKEVYR